ncbi:hypothetical protein AVEN_169232-1 [Araneus ventricosus]|uniref:Uncharacterized protein n=1 Tax=Araneus ventricosus TaxID=182803 RepID=A0A4Y2USF1_ARAVE|nr:hypothetical protein AVEN_169232-1 [Araneus ventricosus]
MSRKRYKFEIHYRFETFVPSYLEWGRVKTATVQAQLAVQKLPFLKEKKRMGFFGMTQTRDVNPMIDVSVYPSGIRIGAFREKKGQMETKT